MSPFDPGLVERKASEHPSLDVHAIARRVAQRHATNPYANPSGAFVAAVKDAVARGTDRKPVDPKAAELAWATFRVTLWRRVASGELQPWDVARELEAAEFHGKRCNRSEIAALRALGATWSGAPENARLPL